MRLFTVSEVAKFMTALFSGDSFDDWLVNTITIVNGPSVTIEGRREDGSLTPYADVKPLCYDAVKGKVLPSALKFVLSPPDEVYARLETLSGAPLDRAALSLALNISFRNGTLSLTTGVSSTDIFAAKAADRIWGEEAGRQFSSFGLSE